jgi:hypothetical protein
MQSYRSGFDIEAVQIVVVFGFWVGAELVARLEGQREPFLSRRSLTKVGRRPSEWSSADEEKRRRKRSEIKQARREGW